MVDQEIEGVDLDREIGGFGHLLRRDRDGVGDVGESAAREGLGFGKRGDSDPAEVEVGLDAGDLDALVGLDMGPQANAETPRPVSHAGCIAFELVEIHEGAGGRKIADQHPERVASDEPQRHRDTEITQRFFQTAFPIVAETRPRDTKVQTIFKNLCAALCSSVPLWFLLARTIHGTEFAPHELVRGGAGERVDHHEVVDLEQGVELLGQHCSELAAQICSIDSA